MKSPAAVSVPLVLLLLLVTASATWAQLPHLDPLPWFSPADSTSRAAAIFEIDRNEDPEMDWSLNRMLTTIVLPAGGRAAWFIRLPVMTFDTGQVTVGQRWPWVLGTDVEEGWPHESIISGFGQIEVGATGPVGIGFMRQWRYGVALGLPTGRNDLYPWSAGGMPLRLELRPGWHLGGPTYLWVRGGLVFHADAAGDQLSPESFPDGAQLGAELAWYLDRGRRWTLGYDWDRREGRRSQLATATAWFPLGDTASLGLRVRTELAGTLDRPALWYFTLAFRFDGRRESKEEPPPVTE